MSSSLPNGAFRARRIPPEAYDRSFFLSSFLEGFEEFQNGGLSRVKRTQLELLQLRPGMSLLEIGYGRGELLRYCAWSGAHVTGIDYSRDAFAIARDTLRDYPRADLRLGDCRKLPFPNGSFERVVSGDVIEHLSFDDAVVMLRDSFRVLMPGGFLLVHTTPNTMFTRVVYPLVRPLLRALTRQDTGAIDEHLAVMRRLHLDEYNLCSLHRIARRAGLPRPKIWISSDLLRGGEHRHTRALGKSRIFRFIGSLGRSGPIRFFLGNDLYLQCWKKN
jgi:ubiquinone/menaquinone biosynthesis C-methylase UbiE